MRLLLALLMSLASECFAFTDDGALKLRCDEDYPCPPPRDGVCDHLSFEVTARYAFLAADERRCILKAKSAAARSDGTLRLKFRNGTARTYKDNWGKKACEEDPGPYENCRFYALYDYFPANELFLVHVEYYESDEWLLV